jgi:iron-sulfur cluster assembly accessory protein
MTAPILTERAATRITQMMKAEAPHSMLRIAVDGGGCSGFQYSFHIDAQRNDDDIMVERSGAHVVIDEISLRYMNGSVIDFVDDLMGQSFKIENPQAKASCGCGVSFTI